MTAVFDVKYRLGDVVYLLTDEDQKKRVVTGYLIRAGNFINYELACNMDTTYHVETEILTEKIYH